MRGRIGAAAGREISAERGKTTWGFEHDSFHWSTGVDEQQRVARRSSL
jgi:hypothetical protein